MVGNADAFSACQDDPDLVLTASGSVDGAGSVLQVCDLQQRNTTPDGATQHSTAQYSTAQYSTAHGARAARLLLYAGVCKSAQHSSPMVQSAASASLNSAPACAREAC